MKLLYLPTVRIIFVQVYFNDIPDKNKIFQGCSIDDFLLFPSMKKKTVPVIHTNEI